jgi:DNA helicase-2/ATP-dependent DNA helicase PcrA
MQLNPQQQAAAEYAGSAKNLLIVAGAGCGKTKTIVSRAVHLVKNGTSPSRLLLITFTNRAAKEMRQRIIAEIGSAAHEGQISTFHAFCFKALSALPKSFGIKGLSIIDGDDQAKLMSRARAGHIDRKNKELNKSFPNGGELVKYHSYIRNSCAPADEYLAKQADMEDEEINLCLGIFKEYQSKKSHHGYIDYDDMLEIFADTLDAKPALKEQICKLYDEVLVDEMQDTNPLQFRILKHFTSENVRLFCVGDPAQSIYRFRGAEFEHVYQFEKLFESSKTLPLTENYRSYQEILDLANWLLSRSPLEYKNKLHAHRGKSSTLPKLVDCDSEYEEASYICDVISDRHDAGKPYKDVMILIRAAFDGRSIEAELIHREIPYRYIGGTTLSEAAHVRDLLSLLRVARNKDDEIAWLRYLTLWPGIGDSKAQKMINAIAEQQAPKIVSILEEGFKGSANAVNAYKDTVEALANPKLCLSVGVEGLKSLLEEKYDKWPQRLADLELLINIADQYESVSDFIDAFTLEPITATQLKKLEEDDVVTLITVHSAKGTEAPICFVAAANPGTYPHIRSFGDINDEEEERRVLYVALTRAKDELFITRSSGQAGYWVENNTTEGDENYFLENLSLSLVESSSISLSEKIPKKGFSGIKDIY